MEKKSEGAFYIWSKQEFDEVVGDDADVVGWFFGVKDGGNVEQKHDMHGEMTGMVSFPSSWEEGRGADDRISSVWSELTSLQRKSSDSPRRR
jgi:uncharacterized protein YyaL (SSP411 family)